jgi:hypothetical protein
MIPMINALFVIGLAPLYSIMTGIFFMSITPYWGKLLDYGNVNYFFLGGFIDFNVFV